MGGTIRIIKKENNEIKSYEGWTNPIPVFTFNSKFYKDKEHASAKIKKWASTEDKIANFNRSEYGVIFIDIDSKRIYECQGYCSLGKCDKAAVSLSMSPNVSGYEYIVEGSKELIEDGSLFYKTDIYDKVNGEYIKSSSDIQYVKSIDDLIEKSDSKSKGTGDKFFRKKNDRYIKDDFYIDFKKYGWEVNSWMDNNPFEFFSKLIEDGYDITNTDLETWDRDYESDETITLRSKLSSFIRDKKLSDLI